MSISCARWEILPRSKRKGLPRDFPWRARFCRRSPIGGRFILRFSCTISPRGECRIIPVPESKSRALSPRLGLNEAETETVAWLIANHLVMSDTAQRRDLSDRKTITTFANLVQTLERLKMLFVLTVCDIRAVGPGVWNNWKQELLRTLYWETEVVLAGGHS